MDTSFLAFLGVSVMVIVTPGPDTAVTIRNTLMGGRAGGIFTALGICIGQTIWAVATAIGIVALLIASEPLFAAMKYAGAAYLVFLGVQALHAAFIARAPLPTALAPPPASPRLGKGAAFRQGLISDLANPKMAMFFASLLPQFVSSSEASFVSLLALGLVFVSMAFVWLTLYALVVAKIGDVLRRSAISRAIAAVTGTVLVALGLRLASERA